MLALSLLMLGVLTDHHDFPLALNDLALFANFLNRRPDFHSITSLFGAPCDAPAGQIIWRHLNCHLIARQNADEIHAQFTGNMG